MKQLKYLLMLLLVIALSVATLTSCELPFDIPGLSDGNDGNTDDGNDDGNTDDGNDDGNTDDGNDDGNTDDGDDDGNTDDGNDDGNTDDGNDDGNTEPAIITIAEALELCGDTAGFISEVKYEIKATVKSITNANFGVITISDETGEITVYSTFGADDTTTFANLETKPQVGDEVVLHCILANSSGIKNVKRANLIEVISSGNNDNNDDDGKDDDNTDTDNDKYDFITIAEALALIGDEDGFETTERYYIKATVHELINPSYGEMTLKDATGEIYVYGTYSADGSKKFTELSKKPAVGDEIIVSCSFKNYQGTKEVYNAWLIEIVGEDDGNTDGGDTPSVDVTPDENGFITIEQALAIIPDTDGFVSTERYLIKATVVSILNPSYGEMNIKDATGEIYVYGTYSADGSIGYAEFTEKFYAGDEVVISCELKNYGGKKEISNARLIEFTHVDVEIDESDYTDMTIADARNAAKGAKVKLDGVVARITYAMGKVPSGFILVDETSSIYVYSGDIAARVAIGNTVTLVGEKTYWILETEQSNAALYGYGGACQIDNASLVSLEETNTEFAKDWITESTVKDILDTPVSENITSLIYKVTAKIVKSPNTGFTNYYFYDLDGETGSYAYTQCNGADFAWLDEFDGKYCTVYITALNAKSTASGCNFRFIPVAVIDEGFVFDTKDAAEIAVKYYGLPSILNSYSGDPALEVLTSVDLTDLGVTGVPLTYTSSGTEVVYFTEEDGKVIMHCGKSGTATVTVSSTYEEVTYSESIEVTVSSVGEIEYVSVSEAISAENNSTVTVKGIVGPSLVNQIGFYLIDETGSVPVRVSAEIMATLEIGQEVIMTGTRTITKSGGGQICIDSAEVTANFYGDHEYSDKTFIKDKTLADIISLTDSPEATTSVYVVEVTVLKDTYAYKLSDGTNSILLYASGLKQYSWLESYVGKTIWVELAVCDWNSKGLKGCVLAVHVDDGKILNELNFNN